LQVGSKVSAVSRKTNTTHREHMGVCTKGDTQLVNYLFTFLFLQELVRILSLSLCLSVCEIHTHWILMFM
jgi:hypothetical protein